MMPRSLVENDEQASQDGGSDRIRISVSAWESLQAPWHVSPR